MEKNNVIYLDGFKGPAKKTPYDELSSAQKLRLVQLGMACKELTDVGGRNLKFEAVDHWVGAQLVQRLYNKDGSAKGLMYPAAPKP